MKSLLSYLRRVDRAATHQQIFKVLLLTGSIVGSMSLWLSTPRVMANPAPTPTKPSPLLPTRNVFNGGFEDPAQGNPGAGFIVPEGYGTTTPIVWQTTEDTTPYANALEIWRGPQLGAGSLPTGSHSGNQYAELNGSTNASIYQDICTIPGETVNWSVWHGVRYSGQTNIMQVSVTDPTLWSGKTPPATKLYNSGNLSTTYSNGWSLKQGNWVNSTTNIKPLRFAFAAIQGSNNNTSLGNFVDDINLDLSPIIDFLPTNVSQNINLASTTEGNTTSNYYLSIRVNGKMQTAGTVQIDLTGLSASRSFTLGAVLQGSVMATGLTATKNGNSITLNIPAGTYDPNLVSNYIHIPIDFSNTVIQPNDALTFTLSNAAGGGGAITPNGISLLIPQLSIVSSSCLGTPRTVVNTALIDDDADLSITNTNGQTTATPGSAVSYNVTVTNNAGTGGVGQTLNSINVVDTLPANLQGVTFTPSTGSYNSSTGAWTGLTLAPGQSITLTVAGAVKSTATIDSNLINTATVSLPTGSTLSDINLANNTAIDTDTITVASPNLLLVKRITAINGKEINGNISLNSYDPETDTSNISYPYDKNVIQSGLTPPSRDKWPNTSGATTSTFLIGARNGGTIKPSDSIEYTIYFLSAGDNTAKNVSLCDLVPGNVTFIPGAFNGTNFTPGANGLAGADRGIAVNIGGTLNSYTNVADGDFAQYFPPGTSLPASCKVATNVNGAVVVNLGNIPNATFAATPPESYGFVRFQGRVK
jgi:uncharacterized repeat protein (TIGR01451 family)